MYEVIIGIAISITVFGLVFFCAVAGINQVPRRMAWRLHDEKYKKNHQVDRIYRK